MDQRQISYTESRNEDLNDNDCEDTLKTEIEECRMKSKTLLKECYDLLTSDKWKVEKVTPSGDVLSSMNLSKPDRKIFKITSTIDIAADKVINTSYDNVELTPKWNDDVVESKRILTIDIDTDLIYQATNTYGNGIIGARDFISLRRRGRYNSYHMIGSVSVKFSAIPNKKNFVRGENGISCIATQNLTDDSGEKCEFTLILNTDLKGWIPRKLVDLSLASTTSKFMLKLFDYLQSLKD